MVEQGAKRAGRGEPWTPKLVALDIDGTLLIPDFEKGFSSEQVTEPVTEAVLDAARAGAHVVLASGRAPLSLAGVADRLGLTGLVAELTGEQLHIVASNGSVVLRHAPMKVVHEITFDANEAVRAVLEHVPGAAVAVEEHGVGYRVNRLFPPGELDGQMIICDLDEMISTNVSRVIIRDPDSTSEDFVNLARRLGLHGTNYFIGWTAWLDIAPEGVSKASGLDWVCRDLGVDPADVLAIGDGRNDIEMLRWAGRGVAMGQSPDVVHAAADHVTAPVDRDGAAVELRRWFRDGRSTPSSTADRDGRSAPSSTADRDGRSAPSSTADQDGGGAPSSTADRDGGGAPSSTADRDGGGASSSTAGRDGRGTPSPTADQDGRGTPSSTAGRDGGGAPSTQELS